MSPRPALSVEDAFGEMVINPDYDMEMLAMAVALQEGFIYQPDGNKEIASFLC